MKGINSFLALSSPIPLAILSIFLMAVILLTLLSFFKSSTKTATYLMSSDIQKIN